ncbi:MAG TPA: hypothetical protein VM077_04105 [Candidatus Limnocylindrales bacterium]|nr:hypothetical protein [Candidatus Limnocylindrales bacterium]
MLDENLMTQVEEDLLAEIVKNLELNKITDEQAQKQAKEFLTLLPIEDKRDLLNKLYKFSRANNEAMEIYVKYAKPIEEEEKQKKLTLMSQHIKDGKIDKALAVVKN